MLKCRIRKGAEMKPSDLINFVRERMRMSHVYQPLLIRTLIESGGAATIRHLARAFAAADDSQVRLYERKIREMPLRVLKRHGVVTVDGDVVRLTTGPMDFQGATEAIDACNQRISTYLTARGESAWASLLETNPVEGSVRYKVLVRDRTCRLCGAGRDDAVLEVDHIIPRSRGGSNDLDNLQVLCRPCNQSKSNADDTDLR